MDSSLPDVRRVAANDWPARAWSRACQSQKSRSEQVFQNRDCRCGVVDCRYCLHGDENRYRRVCDRRERYCYAIVAREDERKSVVCTLLCPRFRRCGGMANTRSKCSPARRLEFIIADGSREGWPLTDSDSSHLWTRHGRDAEALDRMGFSRQRHASPAFDTATTRG